MLSVLCEMVGVVRLQQTVHSSFLQQPHRCQFLESVDLSQRPLVPTLEDILQLCKEQTASAMFCWRGGKRAAVAASSSVAAAPSLSVAVSATWSFGVIKGTEFPSLQVGLRFFCQSLYTFVRVHFMCVCVTCVRVCVCACACAYVCVCAVPDWNTVWQQTFRQPGALRQHSGHTTDRLYSIQPEDRQRQHQYKQLVVGCQRWLCGCSQ